MIVKQEIRISGDGSHTIYVKELDEHYHSHFGALSESRHVFINAGLKAIDRNEIHIFEMGFGTGLNALLTLIETAGTATFIHYTGLEKYPLSDFITDNLNYTEHVPEKTKNAFERLHDSPWNKETRVSENFILTKIKGDLLSLDLPGGFDLVYFDAFAPDKQPELWTPEIFSKIYRSMREGSILTTYSSKGQVRRNMQQSGFRVEKLPGPSGKRDISRAWKE